MKLLIGNSYTELECEQWERKLVEQVFTADYEGEAYSLLHDNNTFLSGLVPYFEDSFNKKFKDSYVEIHKEYVDRIPSREEPATVIDPDILDGITLREYQHSAGSLALVQQRGIIYVATGGGKTEIAGAIIRHLGLHAVFLVHKTTLLSQTRDRFHLRGLSEGDVACLGGGYEPDGKPLVLITTSQSLVNRLRKNDPWVVNWIKSTRVLFIDEAHRGSANSFIEGATACVDAEYRFGLSASPFKSLDQSRWDDKLLIGLTGDIIVHIPYAWLRMKGYLAPMEVHSIPVKSSPTDSEGKSLKFKKYSVNWREVVSKGLVKNWSYNMYMCKYADKYFKEGRKVMMIVNEIAHGMMLLEILHKEFNHPTFFSSGSGDFFMNENGEVDKESKTLVEIVALLSKLDAFIFIGSTIYSDAIDIPFIDTIISLGQGKSVVAATQIPGRGSRTSEGKDKCIYIDPRCEFSVVLKSQANKRLEVYRSLGFDIIEYT